MIEVEDLSTGYDLVTAGAGVAIVPAHLKQSSGQGPALVRLEGGLSWTVGVAGMATALLPLAARLFRQFLQDGAGTDHAC